MEPYFVVVIVLTTFLFVVLTSFIFTIISLYNKKQISYEKELLLIKANYDKELLGTQLEIQEQTLSHISLELHDNVAQYISLSKLHLNALYNLNLPAGAEFLNEANDLLSASLDELRRISRNLNTENIKQNGLVRTVDDLISHVEKANEFKIDFEVVGKSCFLEDQKEIVLFRIIQESFNNILKHSKANHIRVLLNYHEDNLSLSINDDGLGFDAEGTLKNYNPSKSSGLKNILRRSELIHANCRIESMPGQGTSINITTPY
jgi:signal transduction histidine kinase